MTVKNTKFPNGKSKNQIFFQTNLYKKKLYQSFHKITLTFQTLQIRLWSQSVDVNPNKKRASHDSIS